MNKRFDIKVSPTSVAKVIEAMNMPAMTDGEKAARLYLGKKQAEKMARIDNMFIGIWALLIAGAIAVPVFFFIGV